MRQEQNTENQPLYIVIDNSMFIYRLERYDEKKNIAGLTLYKNLADFTNDSPLKRIDVTEWQ